VRQEGVPSPRPARLIPPQGAPLMFLGHIGLALAARRAAPRTSLGTLLLAAQALDGGWALLLAARLERAMAPVLMAGGPPEIGNGPITHSLPFAVACAMAIGGAYFLMRRYAAGAVVVGALILSHWLLDAAADLPARLPLAAGVPVLLLAESALFLVGVTIYLRATRARDWVGSWGLGFGLVALLACFAAAIFAPQPLHSQAFVLAVLGSAFFAPLGFWLERHRMPTGLTGPELFASRLGGRGLAVGMFL
ncbi:MAG TPA: hypothetical protein VF832_06535, partial [Longimicrobiales bacterium]